jgi:biopolymer transport protein ExbD
MRRRGLQPMHDSHVNVTPLIDVVMCLIIFFLLCGKLAKDESNDKVVIPRAEQGQELEQRARLLINLLPAGRSGDVVATSQPVDGNAEPELWVRGRQLRMSDLEIYLKKEKDDTPDVKVILRADKDVAYKWISPVLASCARANIQSVNFSTQK